MVKYKAAILFSIPTEEYKTIYPRRKFEGDVQDICLIVSIHYNYQSHSVFFCFLC